MLSDSEKSEQPVGQSRHLGFFAVAQRDMRAGFFSWHVGETSLAHTSCFNVIDVYSHFCRKAKSSRKETRENHECEIGSLSIKRKCCPADRREGKKRHC